MDLQGRIEEMEVAYDIKVQELSEALKIAVVQKDIIKDLEAKNRTLSINCQQYMKDWEIQEGKLEILQWAFEQVAK